MNLIFKKNNPSNITHMKCMLMYQKTRERNPKNKKINIQLRLIMCKTTDKMEAIKMGKSIRNANLHSLIMNASQIHRVLDLSVNCR